MAESPSTLPIALVQMNTRDSKEANIAAAFSMIERAAAGGARLVCLPEFWTYLGPDEENLANADRVPGPLVERLAEHARTLGIYLHAGSILEHVEGEERLYNTTLVFNPAGETVAKYRKLHLFDVDLDTGASYRESTTIAPGNEIVTFDLDGLTVGLTICYDLRFPELFRILALRGAEVILLPSAFTLQTGRDHWEPLIRARAIENTIYMLAPAQVGEHPPGKWCYGRSLAVDPWGVVLAQAQDTPTIVRVELDLSRVAAVRAQVPSLRNRLPDLYDWPKS